MDVEWNRNSTSFSLSTLTMSGDAELNFKGPISRSFEASSVVMMDSSSITFKKSSAQILAKELNQHDTSHIKCGRDSNMSIANTWSLYNSSKISIEGHNHFFAGNILLSEGSSIDGRGTGYGRCLGTGTPSPGRLGGSHGGLGSSEGADEMLAYDDVFLPKWAGSGGCASDVNNDGGYGGAYLDLRVRQSSELRGTIDLSGSDAVDHYKYHHGYVSLACFFLYLFPGKV
jgi:hypothetical protein